MCGRRAGAQDGRVRAAIVCMLWLACASAEAQLPRRYARAPLGEVAAAQVGADLARERFEVRGAGSVLCSIDTGADAGHPALEGRVRWVLDSFAAPRGRFPELEDAFGGAVWRGDEEGLPGDPHGHGTATASIALGEGGLAPEAALVVVRAYDPAAGGFPDDAVVTGVRFCRALAATDPAIDPSRVVVLLSLGGHDGAHDGRGAFERALEAEARAGPIVVAAGNDGARAVRAAGRLFAGERSYVEVYVPRSQREDAELALTVRAEGALALEAPGGAALPLSLGSSMELSGARVVVEPVEGEAAWRVRLGAVRGALPSGTYRLLVTGPTTFEVWLAGARLGSTFFSPDLGGPHASSREAITIPATASGLVAVAATVSRASVETDRVLSIEGRVGERAPFSSVGPAPSGAPKPDLAAPGGFVLAALSRDVRDGDPDNLAGGAVARLRATDGRVALRGTSAAAAVVAGALLLALEVDPSRAMDARALLVASARGDGAWSPELGAGELDVPRLLALFAGERDERPPAAWLAATRALAPSDEALFVTVRARAERWPSTLELRLAGAVYRAPLSFGTAEVALPPPRVAVGSPVVVEGAIDGAPIDPIEVPVVIERARSEVTLAGGGCAAGGRARARGWLALLALLPLGARRGRRQGAGSVLSRTTRNERT